jgi:geranylgeranylglycerol-phosphate geranylgeranyltransferase
MAGSAFWPGTFGLIRPGNVAVVGLSVLVGSGGLWPSGGFWQVALAAASAMLVAAGGNALNDFFDLEADRVNRPDRPLPRGLLGPRQAAGIATGLLVSGAAMGWAVSLWNGLVAAVTSLLLAAYAIWGKRLALAGNLMVASACAAAFVYGGLAAGAVRLSLIPATLAFLAHLAREIIKDVEDMEGDRKSGARTTGLAMGEGRALALAAAVLSLLVLLTPVPFLMGIYGWRYLAAVVLGADLMLVSMIFRLARGAGGEDLSRISFYIKIVMLVGIMAICLGLSG